jgi:hypothetical protein
VPFKARPPGQADTQGAHCRSRHSGTATRPLPALTYTRGNVGAWLGSSVCLTGCTPVHALPMLHRVHRPSSAINASKAAGPGCRHSKRRCLSRQGMGLLSSCPALSSHKGVYSPGSAIQPWLGCRCLITSAPASNNPLCDIQGPLKGSHQGKAAGPGCTLRGTCAVEAGTRGGGSYPHARLDTGLALVRSTLARLPVGLANLLKETLSHPYHLTTPNPLCTQATPAGPGRTLTGTRAVEAGTRGYASSPMPALTSGC